MKNNPRLEAALFVFSASNGKTHAQQRPLKSLHRLKNALAQSDTKYAGDNRGVDTFPPLSEFVRAGNISTAKEGLQSKESSATFGKLSVNKTFNGSRTRHVTAQQNHFIRLVDTESLLLAVKNSKQSLISTFSDKFRTGNKTFSVAGFPKHVVGSKKTSEVVRHSLDVLLTPGKKQ